ncbi:hypothetical protein AK812_SmicGene4606 [Symbiodinium microadriaticum]|uniref:Uncharacterized protein n=1 Tax=Symbiodinium microadriaticum TaxID=2951 RepID=A0A1Q9EVX7_SYMMI|nr:hypothetical protein AK812_SmicGene4606 [Symbiodinium microadriaticum]
MPAISCRQDRGKGCRKSFRWRLFVPRQSLARCSGRRARKPAGPLMSRQHEGWRLSRTRVGRAVAQTALAAGNLG